MEIDRSAEFQRNIKEEMASLKRTTIGLNKRQFPTNFIIVSGEEELGKGQQQGQGQGTDKDPAVPMSPSSTSPPQVNRNFYQKLVQMLSNFSSDSVEDSVNKMICDVQYISLLCEDCKLPQKNYGKPGYAP